MKLLLPVALAVIVAVSIPVIPSEDAHILYRYAQNLANGHGIVYNDTPVEGATEFLFMVTLAGCSLVGVSLPIASQIIGMACIVAAVFIVGRGGTWTDAGKAGIVALSPLVVHAMAGYGTPLFALCILVMFSAWRNGRYSIMHGAGALTVLCRLEGALLYALICLVEWHRTRKLPAGGVIWFLAPVAAYMAFRLAYFGYPFPNTFYVKATDGFYVEGLYTLGYFAIILALVFAGTKKGDWVYFLPLAIFPVFYLLIVPADNIGDRFQFPVLAASLVLFVRRPALLLPIAGLCLYVTLSAEIIPDERGTIGRRLAVLGRGLKLATTEAGWLPFYSDATTLDCMGLNDVEIAHDKLTMKRLQDFSPDIISFRTFSLDDKEKFHPIQAWRERTRLMYTFAFSNGYNLIAIYGARVSGYTWYFAKETATRRMTDAILSSNRHREFPVPY